MNRSELTNLISHAYQNIGYKHGWSLLYGPFETMWNPKYPLAFFGLNPGGDKFIEPSLCSDYGSSYLYEDWGWGIGKAPLQEQVSKLFKSISSCLFRQVTFSDLLNGSLTANFVPFRSADWRGLEHKSKALEFSRWLWSERIKRVPSSVYITMSKVTFDEIGLLLIGSGYCKSGDSLSERVGWGNVTYQMATYEMSGYKSLLIRLPHLSRYKIFGRKESESTVNHIASISAKYLTQS